MEDTTRVHVTNQSAFFGVYDGHGGSKASEFCADTLHVNLGEAITSMWLGSAWMCSKGLAIFFLVPM